MMSATLTRPAGRTLDVPTVEKALDGLLRAILADEQRRHDERPEPRRIRLLSFDELEAECFATREEAEVGRLADDPVGVAGRQAIRKCGEALHRMGGRDMMHDALERVADLDLAHYGKRATIMDQAWDGIGGEWWA